MSPSLSIRLLLTQSDSRLLELAREGNVRAYEALVQRYRRQLLHYCRRALLPDERAEDALQQAFLQAWLALERGVHVTDAKAWLYRIVHNTALNTLRVSGYDYCKLNETLSGEGAPQEDLDRRIAVREALAGLAALPEMQREALLRTAVEGRSHEHVARDLGVSENALRGLVYRARATLRSAATALTPMPLLSWISNPASRGAPLVERLAEVSASGGSESAAGLVLKGTTVALTLGALATGIGSQVPHTHHPLPGTHQHPNSLPRTLAVAAPARPSPQARSIDLDSFARGVKSGGSTSRKAGAHHPSHDGARSRSTVVVAFPPAQSPPRQPRDRPMADRRGGNSEDSNQPGATSGQGGPSDHRDDGDGRDKAGGPGRTAGPGGGERDGGSSGSDSTKGNSRTGSDSGSDIDSDSGSNSGSTGGSTSGSGSSGRDSSGKGPSGGDSSSGDPSSGDSSSDSPSGDGSSGGKSSDPSSPETGSPADSSQNDSGGGSSEGSANDELVHP